MVEKIVEPSEVGWMVAQGWTLVGDGPCDWKTDEGNYRIEKSDSEPEALNDSD